MDPDELQKAGLPLETVEARARVRSSRFDVSWKNIKRAQWRAAHPDASPEEETIEWQRLCSLWSAMDDEERSDEIRQRNTSVSLPSQHDIGDLPPKPTMAGWKYSDEAFPVSAEILRSWAGSQGIAVKARAERKAAHPTLFVTDKNAIPLEESFARRFTCRSRHSGVCFHGDRDIHAHIMQLGSNLERYVIEPFKRKFFCCRPPTVASLKQCISHTDGRAGLTPTQRTCLSCSTACKRVCDLVTQMTLPCGCAVAVLAESIDRCTSLMSGWLANMFCARGLLPYRLCMPSVCIGLAKALIPARD